MKNIFSPTHTDMENLDDYASVVLERKTYQTCMKEDIPGMKIFRAQVTCHDS